MKFCPSCEVAKPKTKFGKRSSAKSGLKAWCKVCERAKRRADRLKSLPPKEAKVVAARYAARDDQENFIATRRRRISAKEGARRKRSNASANASVARKRNQLRAVVLNYLKINSCADCGETDPVVLEFDHRDGDEKIANITEMVNRRVTLRRLVEEIKKCDVRCANCHTRKTARDFHWYKWRMLHENDEGPSGVQEMGSER